MKFYLNIISVKLFREIKIKFYDSKLETEMLLESICYMAIS